MSLPNDTPLKIVEKVVNLDVVTRINIPVNRVILGAHKAKLEDIVVIGWEEETGELYFASNIADGPNVLWLLEQAKTHLLTV